MVLYLIVAVLISATLCAPAWAFARRHNAWFGWDYAAVLLPIPLWLMLMVMRIGSQSLANLVEAIVLVVLVPVVVSLRVFLIDRWLNAPRLGSLIAFGICTLAAVALRGFMPLLSE